MNASPGVAVDPAGESLRTYIPCPLVNALDRTEGNAGRGAPWIEGMRVQRRNVYTWTRERREFMLEGSMVYVAKDVFECKMWFVHAREGDAKREATISPGGRPQLYSIWRVVMC